MMRSSLAYIVEKQVQAINNHVKDILRPWKSDNIEACWLTASALAFRFFVSVNLGNKS